jgi:diguanylate cyclase (GGDEF)-like protein
MPPADAFTVHLPTVLLLCSGVMGAAAAIMSFFGLSQRVYRGYGWWVAAMWLAAAGGVLQWLRPRWPDLAVPGNLLLLAWPVLVVTGLRQFHNRERLRGSSVTDALLFVLCYLAWLATWASPSLQEYRTAAFSVALCLQHGLAARFVARLEATRRSAVLRALCAVMAAQALLPFAALLHAALTGGPSAPGAPLLAPLMVIPGMVAMLFTVCLCLALTHERTEQDLRETQRQLRVLADIDMLTQVPNRRHFEELAGAALAGGHGGRAVLMLFDIDHFKRINDTHGHAAGDEALRVVARSAREALRTRDVLGRFGGDEFMLLLPAASVEDALGVAERITRRIDAQAGRGLALSLSFGVVDMDLAGGESLEAAQERADRALYEAKRQGRRRAVPAGQRGPESGFGESRSLGLTPL